MSTLEFGERIGKTARLSPAVSGFVFKGHGKLLLTRRTDNGRWCLPGGRMEPGESVAEAAAREVLEETGLQTKALAVLGVTSNPHMIYTYPDGNRWQGIEIDVELRVIGGELSTSDEVSEFGYFALDDLDSIDLMESERERVLAVLSGSEPYVR